MKSKSSQTRTGVLALVVLAASFGITPVLARYLAQDLGLFEQWYPRFLVAVLVAVAVFWRKIDWRKFASLPRREWLLLMGRVLAGQVIGLGLFTLAAQKADIGIVSLMQVMPVGPLLGVILLHERMNWQKGTITLLTFLGAVLVVVPTAQSITHLNAGALLSLLAAVFYTGMLVTRKWHSNHLNNQELTVAFLALSLACSYVVSVVMDHRLFIPLDHWTPQFSVVVVLAGVLSVLVNFLVNYGFEHTSAIVAGNILTLEEVFGIVFGYLFYGEVLTVRELIGAGIIVVSVLLMNSAIKREHRIAEIPVTDTAH